MRRPAPKHWALLAALTVVLSTTAFATHGMLAPDGAAAATDGGQAATAKSHGALPSDPRTFLGLDVETPPEITHEPPFAVGTGEIPTRSEALAFPNRFSRFIAKGSEGLDQLAKEGHVAGAGTRADPYILEDFYVAGDLVIQSTDRAVILRNGYVADQLKLNYIGTNVYVHHVYAKDLRVNENVERNGINTGGLFHDNHFGFVGQIRHFTGEFRDNQVGPAPQGIVREYLSDTGAASLPDGVVFNFDGFHGADMHDNTFHGIVDVKLHGHNHGDCLTCPIHDHHIEEILPVATSADTAEDDEHEHGDNTTDIPAGFRSRHSIRYHALMFRDNTIDVGDDAPFALRYNDRNHAGDDQTANSEPSEFLEDPHVHYQDVTIRGNTLTGAPFVLEVFNAGDQRHTLQNRGVLRIEDNTVEVPYVTSLSAEQAPVYGFHLKRADGIHLRIIDNTVRFVETSDGMPAATLRSSLQVPPPLAGFRLETFTAGDLVLQGNAVNRGDYGVWAHTLADDVWWDLVGNTFTTTKPYRADSTAHTPGEGGDGA